MLIPNLYTVKSTDKIDDNTIKFKIELNPTHEIFEGHFPNNPIMPGVCMIQIIKELTENFESKQLFLSKVSNVKFMAIINPFINPILDIDLSISRENDEIKVKNVSFFETTIALKFSAVFKILA
ncbi:3-hydroxyacyl-[acyl-carrier-protein] dehydratase [Algoriella xinjiangensis]|uniref:3-hydroxyacyl-[acyl-carrier-protein] dehydratase n=1 Tax=Algoriella xinjiangensis TaxID=684065 RepID=A0A1I4X7M0_9FLAO|nr:3-hydroxyacyl-ACP dehydratase [Algoriella xinjiangensis]SFN21426.1 3-hydroxyacyl-[acyl-carrier-protein] dehydratase [Algoriella xinjiangensis]VDH14756.1 (3R)-hydroxymyristoyl-ACP dehydratase [Algoriella xinjiangensis]